MLLIKSFFNSLLAVSVVIIKSKEGVTKAILSALLESANINK